MVKLPPFPCVDLGRPEILSPCGIAIVDLSISAAEAQSSLSFDSSGAVRFSISIYFEYEWIDSVCSKHYGGNLDHLVLEWHRQ